MADLELDISSNLKEIAADVKRLNKNLEDTGDRADRAGRKTKTLGDQMSGAFQAFAIGGAIQAGVSKVLSDLDKSSEKAKVLADSLRTLRFLGNEAEITLRFLGNEAEISSARKLQTELSRFGVQPEAVGPAAANVLSTAGNLPLSTREQILRESGAATAGGISSSIGSFSDFLATGSQASAQFQTPQGITQLANLGAQGITEAKLPPERVGALTKAMLIGLNGGLSGPEAMSAFAVLSKIESTDDAANEKLKQMLKSWALTGARDKGISFIGYVQAVAEKGIGDLVGEERTLQGATIKPFAKQAQVFAAQTGRLETAQFGASLSEGAFQKQMQDRQTRLNIENEEQEALRKINAADDEQRAGTEAGKDLFEAAVAAYFGAGKFVHSLNPVALLETGASKISGGAIPDVGGVLRSSASQDATTVANSLNFATRALNNSTKVTSQADGNLKLKNTEAKP